MKQILTILCIALLCAQCKKTTEEQPKTDFRDELVGSYSTTFYTHAYVTSPPRDTNYYWHDTTILFVSKLASDTVSIIISADKTSFKTDTLPFYPGTSYPFFRKSNGFHDSRDARFGSNAISYTISSGGQGGGEYDRWEGSKQ